jgi:rSAM/selenodomain-associated transferase 1
MSARLYIAARAPRPGLNKTRLARAIGDAAALALYRAFLRDLSARLRRRGVPLGWFVTPDDAWPEIRRVVGPGPRREPVVPQPEGDWGARQAALLRGAAARGEPAVALMASDSPQVDVDEVARGLALLDLHDLVLGPAVDGGYYLIGLRGRHEVLAGVPMSGTDVAARVLARADRLGLSTALLAPAFDVDEGSDLPRLARAAVRADMAATRRALAGLGLEGAA